MGALIPGGWHMVRKRTARRSFPENGSTTKVAPIASASVWSAASLTPDTTSVAMAGRRALPRSARCNPLNAPSRRLVMSTAGGLLFMRDFARAKLASPAATVIPNPRLSSIVTILSASRRCRVTMSVDTAVLPSVPTSNGSTLLVIDGMNRGRKGISFGKGPLCKNPAELLRKCHCQAVCAIRWSDSAPAKGCTVASS